MKKVISTALFLAAGTALSQAALLVGWDFSSATASDSGIAATSGDTSISLSFGDDVSLSDGTLSFTGGAGAEATISSLGIGAQTSDISTYSILVTITSWDSTNPALLWSAADGANNTRTGVMISQSAGTAGGAWNGSTSGRTTSDISSYLTALSNGSIESLTIAAVYSSDGMTIYANGEQLSTDSALRWNNTGDLTTLAIGAWAQAAESANSRATMSISDIAVYSGVVTTIALPEPSSFGLLAGLGALALVAARRRRSRKA